MRKSIKSINSLPEQAKKIEPINGFPVKNKNKDKFEVRCCKCNFVFKTSWDNLTNKSVNEHCGVCRYASGIESKFNALELEFKITGYYYNSKLNQESNPGKTGIQKYGAIAKINHEPCGNSFEKPINNLKRYYYKNNESNGSRYFKCEFCEENNKILFQEGDLLIERAKKVWGKNVVINVNSNGFYIDLPSLESLYHPDNIPIKAVFDANITGRLRGGIKKNITKVKLIQLLNLDEALINSLKKNENLAKAFGAEINFISFRARKDKSFSGSGQSSCFKNSPGLHIKYTKINKVQSNWQQINRAINCNFGRDYILAHQTMILCVLNELFKLNEDKKPVIWRENVKGFFSGNKELDIHGCNLLESLGGIQVEYQGYMSHRNDEKTILRDEDKKKEAEKRGHFFMQIDRINHISPVNALLAVRNAIEKSKAQVKKDFLKYINKNPSVEEIRKEYCERVKVSAERCSIRLKNFCKKNNHKLLTIQNQYLNSDNVDYLCGNCGSKRNLNVKILLETKSGFCNKCKRHKFNSKNREHELSSRLGELWNNIPIDIKDQLVKKPFHCPIECPKCKNKNSKLGNIERLANRIREFNGFLCYYCINTSEIKFPKGTTLGNCTQQKNHIIDIIKKTGWGDSEYWYNYVSLIKTQVSETLEGNFKIFLSLSCEKGHVHNFSLRKWRRIINSPTRKNLSSFCEICNCK